jgi:hypothetical protein
LLELSGFVGENVGGLLLLEAPHNLGDGQLACVAPLEPTHQKRGYLYTVKKVSDFSVASRDVTNLE